MSGEWLPPLLPHDGGEWSPYLDLLYQRFRSDFLGKQPLCQGRRVSINRALLDGKERTFWHLISEGSIEEERTPDFRRCERIAWPRVAIEAVGTEQVVSWHSPRAGDPRQLIALPDFSYVVVLGTRRAGYCHLITAFCVDNPRRRMQFQRECNGP